MKKLDCDWCEGLGFRTVSVENDRGSGDIVREECSVCRGEGKIDKSKTGTYLRKPGTWTAYKNSPKRGSAKCFMCDTAKLPIVHEFEHWLIVKNQFPYDAVAKIHHMLIPRRHFARHMNGEELREFVTIKKRLIADGEYDCIIENFPAGQSHPTHLHYQLLQWKRVG